MMRTIAAVLAITMTGCSVLNPAPFEAPGPKKQYSPSYRGETARALLDSSKELDDLATAYRGERNRVMKDQLLFDIPIMGLAAASVATGIYGASKNLTLGLGLGSASVGGLRAYFAPQVKVLAYNGAASSLGCASAVAFSMANIADSNISKAVELSRSLDEDLRDADTRLASGREKNKEELIKVRDAAREALVALNSAIHSLRAGPARLRTFSTLVVKAVDDRVVTGTQNVDTAVGLIKAAQPEESEEAPEDPKEEKGETEKRTPPGGRPKAPEKAVKSVEELIADLRLQAASAKTIAKTIEDGWSGMLACAIASA